MHTNYGCHRDRGTPTVLRNIGWEPLIYNVCTLIFNFKQIIIDTACEWL